VPRALLPIKMTPRTAAGTSSGTSRLPAASVLLTLDGHSAAATSGRHQSLSLSRSVSVTPVSVSRMQTGTSIEESS
jgi:hypothetical protein